VPAYTRGHGDDVRARATESAHTSYSITMAAKSNKEEEIMTEDPLVPVDSIDPDEFVQKFLRVNPKAKMFHDVLVLAVKKFKSDYQSGYFRWEEMKKKITAYIDRMSQEEVENCIEQMVIEGRINVGTRKDGEDVIWLKRKPRQSKKKVKKK
jgi:hypothetical protein